MNQEIIDLYDEYTHSRLDRRSFLKRLAMVAGSMAAAEALLPLLAANQASAAIIEPGDARLVTGRSTFDGAKDSIKAYMAKPKNAVGKLPAVIVIHENRGLNAHIEDVTRRIALEGFLALAPDLLSPLGGTPENEDAARDAIGKLVSEEVTANLEASIAFLAQRGNGKVGAVGFCWGGARVNDLAVAAGNLAAGVAYYGRQAKAEDVPKIKAPLLLHYGGLDTRVNEGIPAYKEALEKNHKVFSLYIYEGANHAFNNDTSEARFNQEAAELAWSRTIAFFKEHLAAG